MSKKYETRCIRRNSRYIDVPSEYVQPDNEKWTLSNILSWDEKLDELEAETITFIAELSNDLMQSHDQLEVLRKLRTKGAESKFYRNLLNDKKKVGENG